VLVAVDDRRVRPTGLLPGEVMLYGPLGQQVHLTALGKIKIGNDTAELLDVVHQLLDYVQTKISFSNGGGPTGPPSNAAELLLTRAALELLKESIIHPREYVMSHSPPPEEARWPWTRHP
jgi:hypothetical protein